MTVRLVLGDITRYPVDAVVNAANSGLLGGGGVDGAIHRAGGPAILAECRTIRERDGECPTGHAVITGGGQLPARFVIHTVGPVWRGGSYGEAEQLASCYRSSLRLAMERRLDSVAFPSVSTGAYRYPVGQAAEVAMETVTAFLSAEAAAPREVRFVLFDSGTFDAYKNALDALVP
jgi:O-acetyl-ADP-ribose deacetylase (regulator of RNase III)